jgi:hypothetical protein
MRWTEHIFTREKRECIYSLVGKYEGKRPLENLGVDGRIIFWRIDPLLSGDSETVTVATQRLSKHLPVARQQILNNTTGYNNRNGVFLRGPCRGVILTIEATQSV